MIILRNKSFSRRDVLNSDDYLDVELLKFGNFEIDIQKTKSFENQYLKQTPANKTIIKNLIKDIKSGYYYEMRMGQIMVILIG
jgi:hypothetical protein